MAQKITEVRYDDLDGSEGAKTRTFMIDGVTFQIDLTDANYRLLQGELAPFLENATRIRRPGPNRAVSTDRYSGPTMTHGAQQRVKNHDIRAWARRNGHTVSRIGRLPADVLAAYYKNHPDQAQA
ncbi:MAG TPA: Lsr2 family protein [Candidatus Saccharimonadia bacterium]|nr:Lsr2 family protein [Candidatus Saccharimonadia bacterium]